MSRAADALVTVAHAVREAARLGAERASFGAQRPGVFDHGEAPTPAWLTSVLQPHFPGVRVRAAARSGGDAGTTSRVRITVSYDEPGSGDPPPATLFLKLAPADLTTRLFVNLMGLGQNEVRFYADLAAGAPLPVPRAFHAAIAGRGADFVLVLEDLGLRGARFADASQRVSPQDARVVIGSLARLHAAFWNSPRFAGDLAWLKSHGRNPRYRIERFVCATAIPAAMKKFGDLVPPQLRAAVPLLIDRRDRLEASWARGPLTLAHGDAHVGNVFFLPGGTPTAGLFDWQVVQRGQGMRDVAYFLVNSVPTDVRRACEGELIASYVAMLGALGVHDFDEGEAHRQYRLHALYAWIAAAVTGAAATFQPEAVVRAAFARASTAVMDLDALGALHALGR
jgi:aminoglycoside phosphotransferase (APT) family kinase protein